jgi:hypothetical protein
MGCNCGKKKVSAQPKKIVKTQQSKPISEKTNTLKRIIKRTAY